MVTGHPPGIAQSRPETALAPAKTGREDSLRFLTQPEQRRRHLVEEKLAMVRKTFEPGA
jgi:hypothetical protein